MTREASVQPEASMDEIDQSGSSKIHKRRYNFLLDYERFYEILNERERIENLTELIKRCYKFGIIIRLGYLILFMLYFFVDPNFKIDSVTFNDKIQKYFCRYTDQTGFVFIDENNELISVTMDDALGKNMFAKYTYPHHNYTIALSHIKTKNHDMGEFTNQIYSNFFKQQNLGKAIQNALDLLPSFNNMIRSKTNNSRPGFRSPGPRPQPGSIKKSIDVFANDLVTSETKIRRINQDESETYFDFVYQALELTPKGKFARNYDYYSLPNQEVLNTIIASLQTPRFLQGLFEPQALAPVPESVKGVSRRP